MSTPTRVKVSGDLVHGVVPDGAVYIGRAAPGLPAGPYANPYSAKILGRDGAQRLYREHLERHPELVAQARRDLAGRDLACWCRLDENCHGDVLLRIAAGGEP
jgi:Domain of unknown function (DUF4326)